MRRWGLAVGLLGAGCAPPGTCGVELWYVDQGQAQEVAVIGDFNGWDPTAHPMREVDPGAWTVDLDLPPGDHDYMLRVDGVPVRDPYAPLLSWGPGPERSRLRVDDCAQPTLRPLEARATASGELHVRAAFLPGVDGDPIDPASISAELGDGTRLRPRISPVTDDLRLRVAGLPPGKHTVHLRARDAAGRPAALRLPLWVEEAPFRWDDALIYSVMVDRFAGDGGAELAWDPARPGARAGGTLAGLRAKLEEGWFEALGVNVLWLGPVQPNPDGAFPTPSGHEMEGYHGYWATAPDGVDPRLGDAAELDALIAAAHDRGMRVLLDVVPNHVHEEHPWAAEAWWSPPGCVCGAPGCAWSEHIEDCWFADYLPDLDWTVPAAREASLGAALGWAARHNLDGYRVDAVPMMPRAAVRELAWRAREAHGQGPLPFFLLGETFTGPGGFADIRRNLGPFGLSGQFDFPLMWALRAWAAWGSASGAELLEALADSEAAWAGSGAVMSPFVGNHDVSRFVSEAAGQATSDPWASPPPQPVDPGAYERLIVAQALALSLPGAPVLWQGDELGLAGATDPDCRRPVPFDPAAGPATAAAAGPMSAVLAATRALGQARRCLPALRRGEARPLGAAGAAIALLRDRGDGAPALLLANPGDAPVRLRLPLPADLELDDDLLVDVLAAPRGAAPFALRVAPGAATEVELPPRAARLLLPASSPCVELP